MAGPDRQAFTDRRRAESFGASAELYDAHRPSYPAELITWLSDEVGHAADVGCGTGQVARLLRAAGWDVVGVDVDERMAATARSHGLTVEVSRFEDWEPPTTFDLITAGQSWHWIDPDVGYRHAADLLRPGGRLALFWNSYRYDPPMQSAIESAVGGRMPSLLVDSVPFGTSSPDHAALDAAMIRRSTTWFTTPEFHTFSHRRTQTVGDWVAELHTHSPIATLPDDDRRELLDGLAGSLSEDVRDTIDVVHDTRVTSTRRR